ncbi:reverse transcriptase [Holotrichia oblita]|uniref:Reverse transcriptase n=1 Tax=Holotrichia oblita TaxID=644536 RepID=A0ACB9SPK8_HOLOL|nr:reverse transcriptase [Holotrichia oblita]
MSVPPQHHEYALTPLPNSPGHCNHSDRPSKMDVGDEGLNDTLTSATQPGRSPVDYGELSNHEILKHIRLLQQILEKRSSRNTATRSLRSEFDKEDFLNTLNPVAKNTSGTVNSSPEEGDASSICSTGSMARMVLGNTEASSGRKRQASSPNEHIERVLVHPPPSCAISPSNVDGASNRVAQPATPLKRKKIATFNQINLDAIEHADASQSERDSRVRSYSGGTPTHHQVSPRDSAPSHNTDGATNFKVPPIVLRNKSLWFGVSNEIKRKGYSFTKAQNVADGIRIFPTSEADFRGIVKFFVGDNIPFHTYQLPSEKVLNVVLRGIPVEIPEDQIKKQLEEMGFRPETVVRMRRNRGGRPMPLVLDPGDEELMSGRGLAVHLLRL